MVGQPGTLCRQGSRRGTGWVEGPVPRTRPSCGPTWEEGPPSQGGSEASPGRRPERLRESTFLRQPLLVEASLHSLSLSAFWETAYQFLGLRGMPRPGAMADMRGVEKPRGTGDNGGPGIPIHPKCSVPTEEQPVAVRTWFYWSDLFTAPPAQGTRTKAQLTQGGDKEEKGQI